MIHFGKPAQSSSSVPVSTAMEAGMETFDRYEKEVGKWIVKNPLLSIGIALAVGMGMGWILRRR
ncbi:hypothetical protein SH661x_004015 [Planctomicrobium sp. SH661]|uniref:hypothetical protein n=1 Tax=Planctomicrobium sp. SH661 TaxID=3448124 RepID=UPI003F5BDE2F